MTVETPPALQIDPETTWGVGLATPVAKALYHLLLIDQATEREWPLTDEQKQLELGEAVAHLNTLHLNPNLVTEELLHDVTQWLTNLRGLRNAWSSLIPEARRDDLRSTIRTTWSLLALIDREIAGIEDAEPGRLP